MRMECDDDLIPRGHQARVVWDVVQKLDLSAFCEPIKARDGVRGRNMTDPALLICLWLYAATRGVGSARELARLCLESKPYQWICGGVSINHHTLSDFRVGHATALDELFTQVIASLVDKGLVKVHRISQDGLPSRPPCRAIRRNWTRDICPSPLTPRPRRPGASGWAPRRRGRSTASVRQRSRPSTPT
jgi:transposase